MKITKRQLKRIIKEEKAKLLNENRHRSETLAAYEELEMDYGISPASLLEYLLFNWMSDADALLALQDFKESEL